MKKTRYKINYGESTVGLQEGYPSFDEAKQMAQAWFGVRIPYVGEVHSWHGHDLQILKEEVEVPDPFKLVIEEEVDFYSEDFKRVLIAPLGNSSGKDSEMYVRLCSWDQYKNHTQMTSLRGKKVRVTIEEIS